jgi:hypothetical protein
VRGNNGFGNDGGDGSPNGKKRIATANSAVQRAAVGPPVRGRVQPVRRRLGADERSIRRSFNFLPARS